VSRRFSDRPAFAGREVTFIKRIKNLIQAPSDWIKNASDEQALDLWLGSYWTHRLKTNQNARKIMI
jgi:hypothetical protein